MNVLAIETASPPGSLAILCQDGNSPSAALFRRLEDVRRTTETFAGVMQTMLQESSLAPSDINLVATTTGPGSFTGLRIGVTSAKVFAHTVGVSVVGVNTLELLATQAIHNTSSTQPLVGEVEAVLDAQRGELFAARFRIDASGLVELSPTQIIDADEWISTRSDSATLIGTGLRKIVEKLPTDAKIVDESLWVPDAAVLAQMALNRANNDNVSDAMSLVPHYFRKSAAEEKAEKKAGA